MADPVIRLVATDLDGTLLHTDGTVTAGTREVQASYDQILGALALTDAIPLAPTRELALILGTVELVTAEMVERTDGKYVAGDVPGSPD